MAKQYDNDEKREWEKQQQEGEKEVLLYHENDEL